MIQIRPEKQLLLGQLGTGDKADKKKTGIKGKISFFNKGAKTKAKAIKGKYKLVCRTSEEVRMRGKRDTRGKRGKRTDSSLLHSKGYES